MMRVLITGSQGFIGKNLVSALQTLDAVEILQFDAADSVSQLEEYTQVCDFVVHLAGVNRPKDVKEFYDGNDQLTANLCALLEKNNNAVPIVITSSIQADLDNDYGKSKANGEKHIIDYAERNDVPVVIYRLPNMFGKWSRPFYNSVVATWCTLIGQDQEITVNDASAEITLVYIDDLVQDIIRVFSEKLSKDSYYRSINPQETITLGVLASTLRQFHESRLTLEVPNVDKALVKKLYSTYLSYLPVDAFGYSLKMHSNDLGSFTEVLKQKGFGQVSVNVSKPGVTKGNHWHHTKVEKFLVVSGEGKIAFRNIFDDAVIEYEVSADNLRVIDVPPGYTHSIINTGNSDLVTLIWVNEIYDPNTPDTFYLEV